MCGRARLVSVLALLAAGAWAVLGSDRVAPLAAVTPGALQQAGARSAVGNSLPAGRGPWGDLEVVRINTEAPDDLVASMFQERRSRWVFPGSTHDGVEQLFRLAGLSDAQRQALWSHAEASQGGVVIYPEADVLLGLTPASRKTIYLALAEFEQNPAQYDPFRWRASDLDGWFEEAGLADETIALVKKLSYVRGSAVLFADPEVLLATLRTPEPRLQVFKTLSRQSTLLAKLKVRPDSDVDALTAYWGGRRAKDVRALLQSLTHVQGGYSIDVVHLLPPLVRQRIYTYPLHARDGSDETFDCHWTSMNFDNDPPDNRMADPAHVLDVLKRDYVSVSEPYRIGDVLFFAVDGRDGIHSAVYIADDIVFTKNGATAASPWLFMKLDRLMSYYESQSEDLEIRAYRKRE